MKVLLTSGCSFTETEEGHTRCCPLPLSEILNVPLVNYAKSSVGNQYIARTVVQGVERLLEELSAEDLLVGVMWTGIDRHEVYQGDDWQILNAHWDDPLSTAYYNNLHDLTGAALTTAYWQFLTEQYLQNKGVKYFMTRMSAYPSELSLEGTDNAEYKLLKASRKNWLPVEGEFDWLEAYSDTVFTKRESEGYHCHPDDVQHKTFTRQVIMPWLKRTYDIF